MAPLSTFSLPLALLAAAASALPGYSPAPKCTGVSQNANFDDLKGLPAFEINTIPTPYKGLYYQGLDYTTYVPTDVLPGVVPHSGNNYAGANVLIELKGTPMLSVNYPNSKVKSFDLKSFYFGCFLNYAAGASELPNACNIAVTGYKGSDNSVAKAKQVCSQQFQYNPSTALGPQQQAYSGAVKSCFKGLQFAIITFTPPGGQTALAPDLQLALDDIKYTTYKCKK